MEGRKSSDVQNGEVVRKREGFHALEKRQNEATFLKLIHFSPQFFKAVLSTIAIIMTPLR